MLGRVPPPIGQFLGTESPINGSAAADVMSDAIEHFSSLNQMILKNEQSQSFNQQDSGLPLNNGNEEPMMHMPSEAVESAENGVPGVSEEPQRVVMQHSRPSPHQ